MEIIDLIKSTFDSLGIDWAVVLLYVCSGLIGKAYFPDKIHVPFTQKNITDAWRTLIVGTVLVAVYVFIEYKYPAEFTRETLKKLFVSYIFTTSFYEIVLKDTIAQRIVNLLEKLKPAKEENPTT
jgi:hypothetical protein